MRRADGLSARRVLRHIGTVTLPDAVGVRDEFDIPDYSLRHCDALKREWRERIAPNLPAWYNQP
jgi:hypothetical protein